MQVVLQAAYLRQLLGVPPAGSRHPVASAADDRRGAVDVRQAVADSASKARSSLKPFIAQVCVGCVLCARLCLLWWLHTITANTSHNPSLSLPARSCKSAAGSWLHSCSAAPRNGATCSCEGRDTPAPSPGLLPVTHCAALTCAKRPWHTACACVVLQTLHYAQISVASGPITCEAHSVAPC